MRCARCDRIVAREALARLRDGRLVFGWCARCLADEGCAEIDGPILPLTVRSRPSLRARARRVIRQARRLKRVRLERGRKLAMVGIVGLLSAWALILAFVSGIKLMPRGGPLSPIAGGTASLLLAGSGVMALVSLSLWLALIARDRRLRVGLKVVQVAAAIVAFGTIGWAIFRHEPRRDPIVVGVAGAALLVSWAARRLERHKTGRRREPTSAAS